MSLPRILVDMSEEYLSMIYQLVSTLNTIKKSTRLFEATGSVDVVLRENQYSFVSDRMIVASRSTVSVTVVDYPVNCLLGVLGVCPPEIAGISELAKLISGFKLPAKYIDNINRFIDKYFSIIQRAKPIRILHPVKLGITEYVVGYGYDIALNLVPGNYLLMYIRFDEKVILARGVYGYYNGEIVFALLYDDEQIELLKTLMSKLYLGLAYTIEVTREVLKYIEEHMSNKLVYDLAKRILR